VQIAENWSRVRGTVVAWEPPDEAGGRGTLTVAVEQVDPVPAADGTHHRNLLAATAGKTIRMTVPARVAAKLHPQTGATAVVEVRRGQSPDQVFAHPEHIRFASK
jgi:hypothetical protein